MGGRIQPPVFLGSRLPKPYCVIRLGFRDHLREQRLSEVDPGGLTLGARAVQPTRSGAAEAPPGSRRALSVLRALARARPHVARLDL